MTPEGMWIGAWGAISPFISGLYMEGARAQHQGKGVGSMLMDNYLSRLEGTSWFETGTDSNIRFYEKRGFKKIKTVEGLGVKFTFMRLDK
jgi:GNAT superfamily N-acetyltransferase